MSRGTFSYLATALAGSLALTVVPVARAADAPPDTAEHPRESRVDTLIITASPLVGRRFDILQGTSQLSGDSLNRRLQPTIGETLSYEPGITATSFGAGASRPIIRGLDASRVRVLVNGIGSIDASSTSPDHAVPVEPLLADKIEVVRGPSTLLYGGGAAGGVVNVLDSRIPTELPDLPLKLDFANSFGTVNDLWQLAGGVSVTVDHFVLRATGYKRESGNYDIPGQAFSQQYIDRAAMEGSPIDPDDIPYGTLPNSDLRGDGYTVGGSWVWNGGHVGVAFSDSNMNYGIPAELETEEDGGGEEGGGVRIALDQPRVDISAAVEGDLVLFDGASFRLGYADYEHRELEGDAIGTTFLNEGWEGRLQLEQKKVGNFSGAIGGQLILRDFSAIGAEAFIPPTNTANWGIFALEHYDWEQVSAELGGRFEKTTIDNPTDAITLDFNNFTVSGGLAYYPVSQVLLGVAVSHTERAPTAEELFSDGAHFATGSFELGDPALVPEEVFTVEGSVHYDGDRISGGVNVFYYDYSNYIDQVFTGDEEDGLPVLLFTNIDAQFVGAEAEIEALVFDGEDVDFILDGLAAYVRAEDGAGEPLPRIPPLNFLIGATAETKYVDVRAELRWMDAQNRVSAFELPTNGYTFVNANIVVRPFENHPETEIVVRGNNLTNEEARVHASFLKDLVPLPGRDVTILFRTHL